MTDNHRAYLAAAASAADLVAAPAVTRAWASPSALVGFTVGGLAAHLAGQVLVVGDRLDLPEPAEEPVDLLGHYERVTWIGAGVDDDINVAIRKSGEEAASVGPGDLAERLRSAVDELTVRLPREPAHRRVSPPAGPWTLSLADFLVTRMMEIAVHSDDLACSVPGRHHCARSRTSAETAPGRR